MTLRIHNQLTKKIEDFTPIAPGQASLYTCGPTVYDFLHVGNWTAYVYWDTLVRVFEANDLEVTRVMNITDVGHLVSDADDGQDKLEKGAKREGKTAWDVASFYADDFIAGMKRLNLLPPQYLPRATEFISQQLDLVRTLKAKGFTYQTTDGIYFDTAKFPKYADFAHLDLEALKAGARVEFNAEKRNASDFALWKFTPIGEKRDMEWETPVDLLEQGEGLPKSSETASRRESIGELAPSDSRAAGVSEDLTDPANSSNPAMGFPGWHLECSAMAMSLLGDTIDIHTGGIDHIPVHHTNEIAQSEAATGKIFAHYWTHNNHLKVNGTKISKSLENGYTLDQLQEEGYDPLDLRLFILQSHYRTESNFTFENLTAARNRRLNWLNIAALRHQTHDTLETDSVAETDSKTVSLYATQQALVEALSNDIDTPAALALIDEAFDTVVAHPLDDLHEHAFVSLLATIDQLLGLKLLDLSPDINDDQKRLIIERVRAREQKDFSRSDELRDELLKTGILVRDTSKGPIWEYAS